MPPRNRQQDPSSGIVVHKTIDDAGGIGPFLGTYLKPISRVTPKHVNPEAFIALTLARVNADAKLLGAALINPASLVYAMRQCAYLGHLPVAGQFALVPYRNTKGADKGPPWSVVGIEEYRGVIERMYRAGGVVSVHAVTVRENDRFSIAADGMHLPVHEFDSRVDTDKRGRLDGVYAWAVMHTGALSHVVWLNRSDVRRHRDASRSGDAFWGPWDGTEGPWARDMWLKTGLHVLERWVPTSAEYRWSLAESAAAAVDPKSGFPRTVLERPVMPAGADDMAEPDAGIQDAVIVDDGPSQPDSRGTEAWPAAAAPGSGAPTDG